MSADRNAEAASTHSIEDSGGAGIRGIFEDNGVASSDEGFGDEVESLLAAVGDEKRLVFGRDAVLAQKIEKGFFQSRETIGSAKVENVVAFAAKRGMGAGLEFFHGKKFGRGTSHDKRERVFGSFGGKAREDFFAAFIGEEKFPTQAVVAVQRRRRGRRDFQAVAIALDEGAATDVPLNEAFGFQFGVGVGDGGAMNAEHLREFAAGGNAIAGAKVTRVD